jgi:hypothetical protein
VKGGRTIKEWLLNVTVYSRASGSHQRPHNGITSPVQNMFPFVRVKVYTAVSMKNVVFWDIKTLFVLQRRHITSPLQSPAS